MPRQTILLCIAASGLALAQHDFAAAQPYPQRPIRIVTGGGGGGSDFTARLIGQSLTASLGKQVIVDNRPSGFAPGEIVSTAQPDGHTLLISGSTLWIAPLLQVTPWDALKSFAPITLAVFTPSLLVVHPAVQAQSVKELIALAKARPGDLNYGTSGQGSAPHLAAELFKSMAGVNIVRVNYKGAGQALSDLIAGQVQMTFSTGASAVPHVKTGKLRALAVSSARPSALFPEIPTIAASGLPGYEVISPAAVFAPAGTPQPIINILSAEIVKIVVRPEVRERFLSVSAETVGSSAAELGAMMKSDIAKWSRILKDAGIRGEQ